MTMIFRGMVFSVARDTRSEIEALAHHMAAAIEQSNPGRLLR